MHSRVTSLETHVHEGHNIVQEEHENPPLVLQDTAQNSFNEKEKQLEAVEAIYRPVLILMKLCGVYFGETSLKKLGQNVPATDNRRKVSISQIYCCVIVTCLWFSFVIGLVSLCVEGFSVLHNFYTMTTVTMWYFITSLVATTCLAVLPLTERKQSRFKKFLQNLSERRVDLENLRTYSRKGIALTIFILLTSTGIMLAVLILIPEMNIATYKPWNEWHGFKDCILLIQFSSIGVWLLPNLFFCLTCLILERQFDCFCKRVSSFQNSTFLDLRGLKEEHLKLCESVELAEKMFSPLLLEIFSIYIPLLCFNFYTAVNPPPSSEDNALLFSIACAVYWLLGSLGMLCIITVFGSRVNDKIYSVQSILQTMNVSDSDEGKLLLFLFYLNGEQKGLSIGGLVVITKSLSLTIVGVLVSYFAVILTLPK
ncbi:uncharacterized protein LOC144656868 [Oculina patagonica]